MGTNDLQLAFAQSQGGLGNGQVGLGLTQVEVLGVQGDPQVVAGVAAGQGGLFQGPLGAAHGIGAARPGQQPYAGGAGEDQVAAAALAQAVVGPTRQLEAQGGLGGLELPHCALVVKVGAFPVQGAGQGLEGLGELEALGQGGRGQGQQGCEGWK